MRPLSAHQSTAATGTSGAAHGSAAGKPTESRKTSAGVMGSHGATVSGQLRQLKLTDCTSLPAHVQQQLYSGGSL